VPALLSVNATRHGLPSTSFTIANCPSAKPPWLAVRSKYHDNAGDVDQELGQRNSVCTRLRLRRAIPVLACLD
jgi:hypothetical protein